MKHNLVGKFMSTTMTRPALFGYHSGVIRKVTPARKGVHLTIQMHGDDIDAKGMSARYSGRLVALTPEEIARATVLWHGKMRPIAEFLDG